MAKPWEVAGQTRPWTRVQAQETERAEKQKKREAAPGMARAAFERSRNSPEQVAARERDAQHPVRQYLGDWAGGVGDAFSDLYEDYNPLKAVGGTLEGAASLGTSVAAPLFGAADTLVGNVIPDEDNPDNSYATARDKYVYQPRSEMGQDVVNTAGQIIKPLADLFGAAGEQAGEGVESMGGSEGDARMAREIVPDILGFAAEAPAARAGVRAVDKRLPKPPPKLPGPKLPKAATEPSEVARAADIKIPPSAKPGAKGTALESTVGSPQAQARASLRNQPTINRHAAAELGLKGPQKFSEPTFRNLEVEPLKVYDEVETTVPRVVFDNELQAAVAGVGKEQRDNPLLEVAPAVQELQARLSKQDNSVATSEVRAAVRDWRFKAKKLFQSVDDPAKHEQAVAYLDAANAFEDAIERQAAAVGEGDLGQRFRDARTSLAKIYDYETAMVDGNIDIQILTNMKKKGRPLSGRASMLADIGRWFGPETQQGSMVRIPSERMPPWWRTALGRAVQVIGRRPIDELLFSEHYQKQFGDVDANPGPGSPLGAYFDAPKPKPAAPGPSGPTGSGSVDFSGSPDVPPQAALRPGQRIEFARDESGDASIPPAEGRLGDLTASEPPMSEGIPFEASPEVPGVQGRARPTPVDADVAGDVGTFPGAQVPPNASLVEWLTDQPVERRREGGRDLVESPNPPFQGDSTRPFVDDGTPPTAPGRPGDPDVLELAEPEPYPVPDRTAERDMVLNGGGMNADMMLGELFARFPQLMDEVRGDTVNNANVARTRRITDRGGNPVERTPETPSRRAEDADELPQGGIEPGPGGGPRTEGMGDLFEQVDSGRPDIALDERPQRPAQPIRQRDEIEVADEDLMPPLSAEERAAARFKKRDEPYEIQDEDLMPVDDAAIQQTRETLAELGFTPEEIQEILTAKG